MKALLDTHLVGADVTGYLSRLWQLRRQGKSWGVVFMQSRRLNTSE